MRRIFFVSLVLSSVFCLVSSAAIDQNYKVKLSSEAIVAGQLVQPGAYTVKISKQDLLEF